MAIGVTEIILLLIGAIIIFGWLLLLIPGIVIYRRGSGAGLVMAILGAIWGLGSLGCVIMGLAFYILVSDVVVSTPQQFDQASYKGTLGKIIVPYKGQCTIQAENTQTKKNYVFSSEDGTFAVPLGLYRLKGFTATANDDTNASWSASNFNYSGKKEIGVSGAEPTELKIGPPLKAKISFRTYASSVTIDIKVTDQHGRKFTIRKNTFNSPPPSFSLKDDSGKEVWSGKFSYG